MRDGRSTWVGIILIVIGSMFLLDRIGLLNAGDVFHNFWPLLIILAGMSMLLRRESPKPGSSPGETAADHLDRINDFGDIRATVLSQEFTGGKVSNIFGDITIDAARALIAKGEHDLHVSGVFGNIELRLPPGTAYSIHASLLAGGIRVGDQRHDGFAPTMRHETPGFDTAESKIRCRLSQVFGDINVLA